MKVDKIILIILIISFIAIIGVVLFNTLNIVNELEDNDDKLNITENKTEKTENKLDKEKIISLKLQNENSNIESTNIIFELQEDLENYDIIMPDNSVSNEQKIEYRISKNGIYKFILKLEDGTEIEKEIEVKNIKEKEKDKNPTYIPEGFSHKEGTLDTGYVITDQYGNEFVWVPVKSGILTRKNSKKNQYEESDVSAKALVNSVATNYGFYIARYESSKVDFGGTIVSTTLAETKPWNNISFTEAKEYSESFASIFGYNDVKSALINSYAWDTTLNWLNNTEKSYSKSLEYGNYTDGIMQCGENKKDCINNIYDMAGNLKEWTTEILNSSNSSENEEIKEEKNPLRVLRGGSVNQSKSATSQISYPEGTVDEYWGFRMIIYK